MSHTTTRSEIRFARRVSYDASELDWNNTTRSVALTEVADVDVYQRVLRQ